MKKLINLNVLAQRIYSLKTILFYCMIAMNVFSTSLSGQCMMVPIPLEQHFNDCDLVVEGTVTEKRGFETTAGEFIYTIYRVTITKIFKGTLTDTVVEMVEPGGIVDTRSIIVEPSARLEVGESGTFFLSWYSLRDARDNERFSKPFYRAHGSAQSVFRYDFTENKATGVFMQHSIIDWYNLLEKTSGNKYQDIAPLPEHKASGMRMAPSITSFSPTSISAGTFSVLTINGSGFGGTIGTSTVRFKDANDGGASWFTAYLTHIVSWTNTQIQVWVPDRSGTGQVQVIVDGTTATSAGTLTVTYGAINVVTTETPPSIFKTQYYNQNGSGGFTFRYFTDFNANTPARQSFERALNNWRCATEVNFTIGAITNVDVQAADGINVVRFDNGGELPSGVLGQAAIFSDNCAYTEIHAIHVAEIDMIFDDGTSWEYGPALPSGSEFDFESVVLHELGHSHQLGHVIASNQIMHYSIEPGQSKRTLHANELVGGNYIQLISTTNPAYCDMYPSTDYRQVRYVDKTATGAESGDSWSQAFKKLQDALAVVTSCVDTIYVAKGTYYPDEGAGLANNDQTLRFLLNSTVVIMGGYPNGGGTRNLAGNATILSGDIEQDNLTDAQNSQTVVRMTADAHLDGFVIERGYADGASGEAKDGGGLYNSSNGTVRNCIFRFNSAVGTGSNGNGGAIYHASGNPKFVNVLIHDNHGSQNGSAMYLAQNSVSCINCTIAHNTTGLNGVYIENGFHFLLNSIFWDNFNNLTIVSPPGGADVSYSLFNNASLPAGASGTNVMLSTLPLLVNSAGYDFSLMPCSPAINSGNNINNTTTLDLLGNARFVGTIDRGACENTTGPPPTQVTSTGNSGPGTLRTIIADCCSGNTITFAPSLINQTINLFSFIEINKHINIHGPGMDQLNISANGISQIFTLLPFKNYSIKDLSLIEGDASLLTGNCIQNYGNLTLQNVRLASQAGAASPITLYNAGNLVIQSQVNVK